MVPRGEKRSLTPNLAIVPGPRMPLSGLIPYMFLAGHEPVSL
jgi:hypothetical protein